MVKLKETVWEGPGIEQGGSQPAREKKADGFLGSRTTQQPQLGVQLLALGSKMQSHEKQVQTPRNSI